MRTVAELKNHLSSTFSPNQAGVLAEVIYDSYNDLVKTSDFNDLKKTVMELAEAQKELAEAQKELAEAQKQTSIEVRNLARQVGGLSESFGSSLEDFALDLLPDLLEKYWKMEIVSSSREETLIEGKTIEFDLFIEGTINGKKTIVFGEVKSNITKDEVLKFFKLVEKAKAIYTGADIKVIFFGYRAYKEVRELIQTMGGHMIFSNSKSL